MKTVFVALIFFFSFLELQAQNLTGTWVGEGGGTEYIKLVIRHRGDSLVGYTYDRADGYCYASFFGRYIASQKRVIGEGGELLEHTPNHGLTDYDWVLVRKPDGDYLYENRPEPENPVMRFFMNERQWLKRISKKPELLPTRESRLKEKEIPPAPPAPKPEPPKPKPTPPAPKPPVKTAPKAPAPAPQPQQQPAPAPKPHVTAPDPDPMLVKEMKTRESKVMRTIYSTADSIRIFIYDNGEVDGDTVTIFYDDKIVVDRFGISEKPKIVTLPVSRDRAHRIELFANNLGRIPPNTALLVIHAGKERHELHASFDFKTNASILIRYREE